MTPTSSAPAAPSAPRADELVQFTAALHRALQGALVFPYSAQMAHEFGTVGIRFTYRDGAAADIKVVSRCGFPELEAAAMETARAARYPAAPPQFAGRTISLDVGVFVPPTPPDVDSD